MSNTGRKKKLASFNCEEELWVSFMRRCQEKGTTATATLTKFIQLYLDGDLDNLEAHLSKDSNKSADTLKEQIKAGVEEYMEKYLPSRIDKYLAANYLSQNSRTQTKPSKEREFWFIQERARHLGVKLSANQLLRVEMFASDAYKERHGEPPQRRLLRGVQTIAFPAKDVDILDRTIKGVIAGG